MPLTISDLERDLAELKRLQIEMMRIRIEQDAKITKVIEDGVNLAGKMIADIGKS